MANVGFTLRLMRAVILALVAGFAGISSHLYAGGLLPSVTTLLVLFSLSVVVYAALLGRPAAPGLVVLLTVGGQFASHTAISLLAGHQGDRREGFLGNDLGGWIHEFEHLIDDALGENSLMTASHLVASLVVGLWLAAGERALFCLLEVLRDWVCVVLHAWGFVVLHLPATHLVVDATDVTVGLSDPCTGAISRRGPPILVLSA